MPRLTRLFAAMTMLALAFVVFVPSTQARREPPPAGPIFVDTDIGVDDALAVAWLLKQRDANVVGFTTVFGNASVPNATRNLLTILGAAGVQKPVTVGAADPLALPRTRTGSFIHGPDGLWFAQQPADISALPTDAPAAIAAAARANHATIFIALGPLTNFARAIQQYPQDLAGVRLVALAGGRHGNITPVAEFNVYADPEALEVVLAGPMNVELVTLDAFEEVTIDSVRLAERLSRRGGAVGQLLAAILPYYTQASTGGMSSEISLADPTAVVYALRGDLGTPRAGLVRVITGNGYARGQTIIADTVNGRIPMIADDAELSLLADQAFMPGFDINAAIGGVLARQPDNANLVLDVDEDEIVRQLLRGLTR